MRQDQFEKLQTLSERLTDVALEEADPDNWHGKGLTPDQMTRETRGDRYWCKKNAVATLSLIQRIHGLTDQIRKASAAGEGGESGAVTGTEDELDNEINAAEKEAVRLLDKMQRDARHREFMTRTNGKP